MAKFRVSIFIKNKPFSAKADDIHTVMELIDVLAEKPLDATEELNTLKDLARLEHQNETVDLSIAGRPISVTVYPDKLQCFAPVNSSHWQTISCNGI